MTAFTYLRRFLGLHLRYDQTTSCYLLSVRSILFCIDNNPSLPFPLSQYRPYFSSSVKEVAVFIDLAPKFQLMAEEVLQCQIQLVMSNLKQVCSSKWWCLHMIFMSKFYYLITTVQFVINQAIDGANEFHNTHQIKQYESAKFCIDQVLSITKKPHCLYSWSPFPLILFLFSTFLVTFGARYHS